MNGRPLTFEDLKADCNGRASKAAFVTLANELIANGRRPDVVYRAMLNAALAASLARSTSDYYSFTLAAESTSIDARQEAEEIIRAELSTPEARAFLEEVGIDEAMKDAKEAIRD